MRLLAMCLVVLLCSGCATAYEGLTNLRIKAKKFKGQFGAFHSAEGENVDLSLTRKMGMTGDKNRVILPNPNIGMSSTGNDSTFDVISGNYTS